MGEGRANRALAREILLQWLQAGARHAVLSPGSRNTPVVLELVDAARAGRIELHSVLDERMAGFLALGLCRASGGPVLLSCTSGTAGAHYWPAVAEAGAIGLPLVALTADRPDELQDCGAPQTMDQDGLFGTHVRAACTLSPGMSVPNFCGIALGKNPGPVHVNLRFRKPLWEEVEPVLAWPSSRTSPGGAVNFDGDGEGLVELRDALEGSRRGLVVVGPRERSVDGRSERAILDFVRRNGWPLLAEPASGLTGDSVLFGAEAFLRSERGDLRPDLVLRFGRSPTARSVSEYLAGLDSVPSWLIEASGRLWDAERVGCNVIALDPEAVLGVRTGEQQEGWLSLWQRASEQASSSLETVMNAASKIWSGAVVRELWSCLDESEDLHVASSMAIRDLGSFADLSRVGPRVSANRGTNGIDGTIACAVGQARASGRKTTVMLGDLALLHDQASLGLVGDASLRIVVVDNGGGAIFEYLPIAGKEDVFEPYFLTPQVTDIPSLCRAHGVACESVDSLEALQEALKRPAPMVIHVRVDRRFDFDTHQAYWREAVKQ